MHAVLAAGDSKLLHEHVGEHGLGTLGYDCRHLLGCFKVHLQPLVGAIALGADRQTPVNPSAALPAAIRHTHCS